MIRFPGSKPKTIAVAVATALIGMSALASADEYVQLNNYTNNSSIGDYTLIADPLSSFHSTSTGSWATDVSVSNNNEATLTSVVQVNTLTNNGTINGGVNLQATSDIDRWSRAEARSASGGDAYSNAYAYAAATANSNVQNNVLLNTTTGLIYSGGNGIQLHADSYAEAYSYAYAYSHANTDNAYYDDAYAYTSSYSDSVATSTVNGNAVTNKGGIYADGDGINLSAHSFATADWDSETVAETNGGTGYGGGNYEDWDGGSTSTANSSVNGNTITNDGFISSDRRGIALEAYSGNYNEYYNTNNSRSEIVGNTIVNNGMISSRDDAIQLWSRAYDTNTSASQVSGNQIINNGTLYTLASGVHITSNANYNENASLYLNYIENNGRIVAADTGIHIWSPYVFFNEIKVSGVIVSDPGMQLNGNQLTKSDKALWDANAATAISIRNYWYAEAPNNTIDLNAPAYLAGLVLVDWETDTHVNLTSGKSHSVRWAFQNDGEGRYGVHEFNTSGTTPWFHNSLNDVNNRYNDVYATMDPTALAAAPNQLADLSSMVSNLARTGLDKDTTATGGFWMNAQGGTSTYDATNSTFDYTNNLYGIALGYNQTVLNDLRVGVMVGYDNQKMRTGTSYSDLYRNSYDNKADGAYLSAHATKDFDNVMFKKVVVDLGLSLGYQSHDDKRFVNDNLAWWGQSYAKSSYNSVWYNPELGVSIPFSVIDESITLSPNARLSWAGQHIDSYTENGSNSNASVDSRNLGVLESRIGLDLTKQYNGGSVTISAGYLNRTLTSSNSVKVSMIGDTQNVDYHYQNIDAGYLRGALSANVMENIELGVNGTYINGSGMDGGSASATIKVKF